MGELSEFWAYIEEHSRIKPQTYKNISKYLSVGKNGTLFVLLREHFISKLNC